jgi:hypothetical protein
MKSIALLILSLLSVVVVAQESKPKKFYLETIGGYGFPLVNDELGSTDDRIGTTNRLIRADSSISILPAQGTQGPGWQFSISAGYMFHPNIGVEGEFRYLKSNRFLLAKNTTPTYQAEHSIVGERLDIVPQIVFSFNVKEKWNIYSKSGVVIPVWGRSRSDIKIEDQEGRLLEELTGVTNPDAYASVRVKASTFGKFSYGFQTRLGAGYAVLDWMTVFAELKFVALSIRSKEDRLDDVDIRVFSSGGGSALEITEEDLDEIEKRTVFVNELTENSNNPLVNENADPNKPLEELTRKDNFNQLGVSIGVRFYIK